MEIKITIDQLERLLEQQKKHVIDKLSDQTGYWNGDSDDGTYRPVNINKEKFTEQGMKSAFPEEFNTLKKYIR